MLSRLHPVIRALLAIFLIACIFSLPVREWGKITFILGIPFVFTLGFMQRKKRYSPVWILAGLLIIVLLAGYGYMMTQLPERIEIRRIISEGGSLVAEERYDEAIVLYGGLADLGRSQQMEEKIARAQKEKIASQQLDQALNMIQTGHKAEAILILEDIPADTRAGYEAKKRLRQLKE